MKVLQINCVCGYGSTGRIAAGIYKTLVNSGHSCKIAYGRGRPPDEEDIQGIRIGSDLDVNIHALYTRVTGRHGFASRKATRDFIEAAGQYSPDLIHLHNIHGYYINIELLFNRLRECGKPVVWTLHDCWAYTGHCAYYSMADCSRWRSGCHSCPQKRTYPASLLLDSSRKNYEDKKRLFTGLRNLSLVTPSKWLKKEVEESFLSAYPVTTIYNGIDTELFKPSASDFKERHGIAGKTMLLGVASVWTARKGLETFIRLSRDLDDTFCIVLVGLSAKQLKKLPAGVLGTGETGTGELAEIYTAADVFINPSTEESMGLVTAEAMACGTPAVVYPHTAVPEVVDESGGIVAKGYDELLKAVKNRSFKKLRPDDCVRRAGDFEQSRQYGAYLKLYEGLLS